VAVGSVILFHLIKTLKSHLQLAKTGHTVKIQNKNTRAADFND